MHKKQLFFNVTNEHCSRSRQYSSPNKKKLEEFFIFPKFSISIAYYIPIKNNTTTVVEESFSVIDGNSLPRSINSFSTFRRSFSSGEISEPEQLLSDVNGIVYLFTSDFEHVFRQLWVYLDLFTFVYIYRVTQRTCNSLYFFTNKDNSLKF